MIRLEKVNKWYGAYHALADVDEQVGRGEVVVVCGPSGSGKSTLIRTLNRLEPIQGGRILIDGQDIHAPGLDLNRFRSHIGFVFQQFNLFPHLNVLDNCTLAPLRLRGLKPAEARRQAMALLEPIEANREAHPGSPSRVVIGSRVEPGGLLCLWVRDQGPGVPADQLEHIFTPFHTSKPEGLGLGLSMSRSIVEGFGGTLEAELPADGGLLMNCRLPLAAGATGG